MANSIVDTKISVTWLISTIGATIFVLVGIAIQFNNQATSLSGKLDAVLASNHEMKQQLKEQNGKSETLKDFVYDIQRKSDVMEMRISTLEQLLLKGKRHEN